MNDFSLQDVLSAFPAWPLGKSAKELRRLAETIGGADGLDRVGVWTDLVNPLLAAENGDLPGLIMFLDPEACAHSCRHGWRPAFARTSRTARSTCWAAFLPR